MKKIVYVGLKPQKGDNVAKTGLVWKKQGDVQEVADDEKAAKLLEYPDIWADADAKYELRDAADIKAPVPTASVLVPGARFEIAMSAEALSQVARGELRAVFMTDADEKAFAEWKLEIETAPEPAQKSTTLPLAKRPTLGLRG